MKMILYQVLVLVMLPFPHPLLHGDHLDQWDQFPSMGWQTLCVQLPVSKSWPSQGSPPCSEETNSYNTVIPRYSRTLYLQIRSKLLKVYQISRGLLAIVPLLICSSWSKFGSKLQKVIFFSHTELPYNSWLQKLCNLDKTYLKKISFASKITCSK